MIEVERRDVQRFCKSFNKSVVTAALPPHEPASAPAEPAPPSQLLPNLRLLSQRLLPRSLRPLLPCRACLLLLNLCPSVEPVRSCRASSRSCRASPALPSQPRPAESAPALAEPCACRASPALLLLSQPWPAPAEPPCSCRVFSV